jgi:hypothetical protein
MLLARVEKYLVIKRAKAAAALQCVQDEIIVPATQLERAQIAFKASIRADVPMPNYPSRKWLAGYFDGDGCLAVSLHKNGFAYIASRITSHVEQDVGIRLIQKAFGGGIHLNRGPNLPCHILHLVPSKAKEFLGFFSKHLVLKRAEAEFVLGCAEGGNYRDGIPIRQAMKQLKAREQRLNQPDVDTAALIREVRFDVPDGRGKWMRK